MRPLIFAHANSFPAGTYDYLFAQLRARGFAVHALPRFGHDPAYPVTDNWPHLVQQLKDFAQPLVAQWGQPAYFVGHSLGGFVSLMTAAQTPELARGVLLLDSPLLGGWRATSVQAAKRSRLVNIFFSRQGQSQAPHPLGQRPRGAGALSAQTQFCPLAPTNTARLHSPRPAPGCTGPADPVVYARRGNGHLQQPAAQPEPAAAPASTALPGGLHWRATVTRNAPSGHGNDPARNAGAHHGAGRQPLVSHGAPHHHGSGH